jgi:hypothetical protein
MVEPIVACAQTRTRSAKKRERQLNQDFVPDRVLELVHGGLRTRGDGAVEHDHPAVSE